MAIALNLHGKADATYLDEQSNKIIHCRSRELSNYSRLDEAEGKRDASTRCRGTPIYRGNGLFDSSLCGGARLLDAELLHARPERVGMEAKPSGCALLSFDNPAHILEDAEDMGSFDFFQGIGDRQ